MIKKMKKVQHNKHRPLCEGQPTTYKWVGLFIGFNFELCDGVM
jgi:hypothetical protein